MVDDTTRADLESWYEGDRNALDRLLKHHVAWIREQVKKRLGQALRRKVEEEDVVQEVIVRILKFGPQFVTENESQFRALMVRIVENVLRDQHDFFSAAKRDARKEREIARDSILYLDRPVDSVVRPSQIVQRQERGEWIQLALQLVGEKDRHIVALRLWRKMSFVEIAQEMKTSEDAARMAYIRALARVSSKVRDLKDGKLDDLLGLT